MINWTFPWTAVVGSRKDRTRKSMSVDMWLDKRSTPGESCASPQSKHKRKVLWDIMYNGFLGGIPSFRSCRGIGRSGLKIAQQLIVTHQQKMPSEIVIGRSVDVMFQSLKHRSLYTIMPDFRISICLFLLLSMSDFRTIVCLFLLLPVSIWFYYSLLLTLGSVSFCFLNCLCLTSWSAFVCFFCRVCMTLGLVSVSFTPCVYLILLLSVTDFNICVCLSL